VDPAAENTTELQFVVTTESGQTRTVSEHVAGAAICPDCFEIRGLLRVDTGRMSCCRQLCACEWPARKLSADLERWPGFDFNTYLELCHCCTITPLKSGSRWSPFFCPECHDRVLNLNRRAGGWVIPIGRHSAMHGQLLHVDEALIDEHAEHFVIQLRGLSAGIDYLRDHRQSLLQENLRGLGFPAGKEIQLADYLTAAHHKLLNKELAFAKLREQFVATE
jgi:hypothetical protein